jgi:gas vesicle protein
MSAKSTKKMGLGILIGAVAGVVTGLLTAPKSGKETRADIKNKAKDVRGSAERKLKDAYKDVSKVSDDLKAKTKNLTGKAKTDMTVYSVKADELKAKLKAAITSVKNGDNDDDDATIDTLLKDLSALKDKIKTKAKEIKS